MRKRWLLAILLAVVLGVLSYEATRLVQAAQPRTGPSCRGFALLQRYLNLTANQRDAIAGIDDRYGRVRPELRQKLWDARDNLLNVLQNPQSTQKEAVAAARRFGAAQQALQLSTIGYAFELRGHLTPEQRTRMHRLLGRGICAATCGAGLGRRMGGPGLGKAPAGSGSGCPAWDPGMRGPGRGPRSR